MDPPADGARGWQPDPEDASRLRYWTGDSWTDKTRPWPEASTRGTTPKSGGTTPKWAAYLLLVLVIAVVVPLVLYLYAEHQYLPLASFGLLLVILVIAKASRPDDRPCPRCGQRVANGVLDCPHCGFDFRTIGT